MSDSQNQEEIDMGDLDAELDMDTNDATNGATNGGGVTDESPSQHNTSQHEKPLSGLTLSQAKQVISDEHGVSVDASDPLMLTVTLINEAHRKQMMLWSEEWKQARKQVKQDLEDSMKRVSGDILTQSVQEVFEGVAIQVEEATRVMEAMKRLRWWLTVLTALVLVATVAMWTIMVAR